MECWRGYWISIIGSERLVIVAGAVEIVVIQVEVEGAFAFGEHEFAELIVDLGIDGEIWF